MGPKPLEAGELKLDGHAGLRGGVDHFPAVADQRRAGEHARRPARPFPAAPGPQRVGGRVEPEHDLRLALGHARGQGVAKATARRQRLPFTALLRPLPAVKRGTREAAIWMRSPVRGLTPSRAPRWLT